MAGCRLHHWQSPFWGVQSAPALQDRGKAGSRRSILVDGSGEPLSAMVDGANVHDT